MYVCRTAGCGFLISEQNETVVTSAAKLTLPGSVAVTKGFSPINLRDLKYLSCLLQGFNRLVYTLEICIVLSFLERNMAAIPYL